MGNLLFFDVNDLVGLPRASPLVEFKWTGYLEK